MSNLAKRNLARWTALGGYYGLLILLLNWYTWYSPPTQVPRALLIIVLLGPLLIPMRGLLHARPYTHAWASFLALPYFALGVDIIYTSEVDRWLGAAQVGFSVLMFFGCVYFPRYARRADAAQTPSDT